MTQADKSKRNDSTSSQPLDHFLTRQEAAATLRCSLAKLDRCIASGDLRAKKHGHSTFVMASEIERYISQWPNVKPRTERIAR